MAIAVLLALFASSSSKAGQPDPLENFNRPVHEFNSFIDALFFRPLAVTYKKVVPQFMKRGIRNVLSNLDDVAVTANDLLQGNFKQAGSDFGRVVINSTLGIGGILDVADTAFSLEKHHEDFGQTLAHWGVKRGPYLVLPLLGPSTVREGIGGATNILLNPGIGSHESNVRDKIITLNGASARAGLLGLEGLISGDEYLFVREAYLQNLDYREADGSPSDLFEEF